MILPDMSSAVNLWADDVVMTQSTQTTIDFEPQQMDIVRTIKATIQPAQKARLNPDKIDWSKKHVQVHSVNDEVSIGETFIHLGETYRIVDSGDFTRYGFTDAVGEQVK